MLFPCVFGAWDALGIFVFVRVTGFCLLFFVFFTVQVDDILFCTIPPAPPPNRGSRTRVQKKKVRALLWRYICLAPTRHWDVE